ncbi:MAG: hypothetical protein NZZ41_02310 [Candidatus Dojkabacteria bacterium]|nr:hypothetical protein [Candidatus Dojkabacteria bacterium]
MDTKDRERLKKSILELKSGEIEFRSYTGHTRAKGGGWTAEPVPNKNGNWYKGVERVTREMKESGQPYVDPTDEKNTLSRITIYHGLRMDMSIPENRLIMKWLVEHDRLALSYEEGKGDPMKLYYIHDEIVETNNISKKYEVKKAALEAVTNLPDSSISKYVRNLGIPTFGKSPQQLRNMLYDVADKTPEKVLDLINDKRIELKDFVLRCLDHHIIRQSKTGEYTFNGQVLAPSYEGLLTWLANAQKAKSGDDAEILLAIKAELDKK